jgi:hypothetical protein
MADSFAHVCKQAEEAGQLGALDATPRLRELDAVQRRALGLFLRRKEVSSAELADFLGVKPRGASLLAAKWVKGGLFDVANPSKKGRRYRLASRWEAVVGAGCGGISPA